MTQRLKALREKRGKLVKNARDINDRVSKEEREFTEEERAEWDRLMDEAQRLKDDIDREERLLEAEREEAEEEIRARDERRRQERGRGTQGEDEDDPEERSEQELAMRAFHSYLRTGRVNGEGAEELRALQAGIDVEGGYLVAPEQFVNQLLQAVDDAVFVRRNATTFQVPMARSLGVPTLDTDPNDADWTSELATGSEDDAMRFGKRTLHPHPLAKRIKISNQLLRQSLMSTDALIAQRFQYKFGVTEEKGYLLGTGSQQPLGVYVASGDGISTGRDVSTGNTSNSVTFDGLIEAKYTLKSQYWPMARWNFHRDTVKQIAKLKDGEGQYIWRQSVREGEPDTVLGRPMDVSEFAPNTFTTGQYVGLFCDWSFYWIADAIAMQIQRLQELYAETNQVGLIARRETDGMPVLEEAFVRVKLG